MGEITTAGRRMSVDAFLAWEGEPDRRYQLIDGEPVMMAPASDRHGVIVINLGVLIRHALGPRSPYRVRTETGIPHPERADTWLVADLAVSDALGTAGPSPRRPVLIAEVLSPSTVGLDRTIKLAAYRKIISARDLLFVCQDRAEVEHHVRSGQGDWTCRTTADLEATVQLSCASTPIAMDQIYDGVVLDRR